jgi:tetratricopeptide (TPR) repeat protein
MGILEKAISFLEPLLNEQPNDFRLRGLLAWALRLIENFKDSIKHYEKCLDLAPGVGGFWVTLGITYEEMENFEEAENCFRHAIELGKESLWAHYHLGRIFQKKKKYEGALQQFRYVINAAWEFAGPHFDLADIYREHLNQPEEAIKEYEIGLQLEQRPYRLAKPILSLARALEAAGRTAETRQRYQEYLDRFPWGEHAPEALAALERLGA